MTHGPCSSCATIPTSPIEILNIGKMMRITHSTGCDDLDPVILSSHLDQLAIPLTEIFNSSFAHRPVFTVVASYTEPVGCLCVPCRLYYRHLPTIASYVIEDTELVGESSVESRLLAPLAVAFRIIVSQVAVVSFQSQDLCRLPARSAGGQLTLYRVYMPSMPSRSPNLVRS